LRISANRHVVKLPTRVHVVRYFCPLTTRRAARLARKRETMLCGNLLSSIPWGLVLALQWLTAVTVLRELAPALTEPRRHTSAAALVAAFLLTTACVRDLQRFRTRGTGSQDENFRPRSAALPTSAAVEEAQWAVPTCTPPRPAPLKETQLREVAWVLSPGSPVGSFAPAAAQAHESILHAEDGACAKWCAACDAWVRLPAAHCAACGRCTRLRSGHSHRLRVCVGADNRRCYCLLLARTLLLQLGYLCLAAAQLLEAPEAAPLRRALRAAARAWAGSGSGSHWRVPQLTVSSAELLPCAPAVALLALGASMLPSYHPSSALAVLLLALGCSAELHRARRVAACGAPRVAAWVYVVWCPVPGARWPPPARVLAT